MMRLQQRLEQAAETVARLNRTIDQHVKDAEEKQVRHSSQHAYTMFKVIDSAHRKERLSVSLTCILPYIKKKKIQKKKKNRKREILVKLKYNDFLDNVNFIYIKKIGCNILYICKC